MKMKNIFTQLCKNYTNDNYLIQDLWQEITLKYNEPHRQYHTLSHLKYLFKNLQPLKHQIEDWNSTLFSIFYHDIIYDIRSDKNEKESAIFAKKELQILKVDKVTVMKVINIIKATEHHNSNKNNKDTTLFLDADLAILGVHEEIYQEYIHAIRQEYSIYEDEVYYEGRKKVLEHFISRRKIYNSDFFYNNFEKKAKNNLKEEYKIICKRYK